MKLRFSSINSLFFKFINISLAQDIILLEISGVKEDVFVDALL